MKTMGIAIVMVFLAAAAFGQPPDQRNLDIEVGFLFGLTGSATQPVLNQSWLNMFQPPKEGMSPKTTAHPVNLGLELRATWTLHRSDGGGWQVGLPISYGIWNMAVYRKHPKNYFGQKGVAGTHLNWWDPVMVNDIVVQNFSPRVGLEFAKGRFSITPSVQHFRLMARDYSGKDCYGCKNTSSVTVSRQLEAGISPRLELLFAQADNRPILGASTIGFYVEGYGTDIWGSGIILRWKF